MQRFRLALRFLAVTVLLLTPATTLANGPPVTNETDHLVNVTETFIDVHPCTGAPIEITVTYAGVMHFSAFADGTVHFAGTLRGTFSADLLPPDGLPDATGTFTNRFSGNGLLLEAGGAVGKGEDSFSLNGKGTNADGSTFTFHSNGHNVFDAAGVPKLEFINAHCK